MQPLEPHSISTSRKIDFERTIRRTKKSPRLGAPDILLELGKRKNGTVLVGFAAETENFTKNGLEKLKVKNLDLIVINPVGGPDSGFASDTNRATILDEQI